MYNHNNNMDNWDINNYATNVTEVLKWYYITNAQNKNHEEEIVDILDSSYICI